MKRKNFFYAVFCVGFLTVGIVTIALAGSIGLMLDKTTYGPGESITVEFAAPANFADNAWVGIIPSNVKHGSEAENDRYDITYQYLKKRTSGTLVFKAPPSPGNYDIRMHDTDSNGKEVASVSFVVSGSATSAGVSMYLETSTYSPGDEIRVHFTALSSFADNAWVGIIPSHVPHGSEAENDRHDITYQYLRKRTSGTLVFKAPPNPGVYDFRMHDTDSNGREVSSVTFTVR